MKKCFLEKDIAFQIDLGSMLITRPRLNACLLPVLVRTVDGDRSHPSGKGNLPTNIHCQQTVAGIGNASHPPVLELKEYNDLRERILD
jgi:hypothetical protein